MLKIGIISNPFAKVCNLNPEYNTQLWYTLGNHGQFEITRSEKELEAVCREFCARGINAVGIVGGDGSISLALTHLSHAYQGAPLPKIFVLKGGTINFLASNLRIKKDAISFLKEIIYRKENNLSFQEKSLATINVNGRIGFIFANGMASNFLVEFYKNKTNIFHVAMQLGAYFLDGFTGGRINGKFKNLTKKEPMSILTYPNALLKVSSEKHPENYSTVLASTVPNLPFKVNLFKKIKLNENQVELLVVSESQRNLLKEAFLALFLDRDVTKLKKIESTTITAADIQCEKNSWYSVDGDLVQATQGLIEIKRDRVFTFCSNN